MLTKIIKSFLFGILLVAFPVTAGVTIALSDIKDETVILMIQSGYFLFAGLLGVYLYKNFYEKSGNILEDEDVSSEYDSSSLPHGKMLKNVIYFIPLFLSELPLLFTGLKPELGKFHIFVMFFFCIFVAVAEEVFFRGIIYKVLKAGSHISIPITVSSLLFSVLHLTRLIPGIVDGAPLQTVAYTVMQLIYSLVFGITASLIVVHTSSIIPGIIWHFFHNFITLISIEDSTSRSIITLTVVLIILIIYIYYLSQKIQVIPVIKRNLQKEKEMEKETVPLNT